MQIMLCVERTTKNQSYSEQHIEITQKDMKL